MAAAPPMDWLVDRNGNFNPNIEQVLNLASENCPIAAVSIIGVQSTGKSTLLNKCFSTNFQEMDERRGISQTTQGIWIAKGPSLNDGPKILLIDTEGSDGSERGRMGDNSFERKSAAFALAMSNTVIVNMKCENVGLHNGASWPLLKTVFQVMLHKFTGTPRKVLNLMFVLRDKNKSPLDTLKTQLTEGLNEIWRGISSSEANRKAKLEDYFNVVVMTMPHYVHQRKKFDKEVKGVRDRLSNLVKDGQRFHASAFLDLAKKNWDDIIKNNILNLNVNKVMVEKVVCHGIMEKKKKKFLGDKKWLETKKAVESGKKVPHFGKVVNTIMEEYLSQYDKETLSTDESTRNDYRNQLIENLSQVVEPSYLKLVKKMRKETLEEFLKEMVKETESRGKFETINSDKFFKEFKNARLTDAEVKLASWNDTHTSSQLEEMQSKLDSYKKAAGTVMEKLAALEESKVTMLVESLKGVGGLAALSAAIAAPPIAGVVGIAVLGLGVAFPLPPISIVSIIQALIKHVETKKDIGKERKDRPEVDKIFKALEGINKQENKDRK